MKNVNLAQAIWDEDLKVRYEDLAENEYGYFHRNVNPDEIVIAKSLLGQDSEAAAKIAAAMSHEGSHWAGNPIEALAQEQGFTTYSQINALFNLKGDTAFYKTMIDGYMNPDSWRENDAGERQDWKVSANSELVKDQDGWLKDQNGKYINKNGTRSDKVTSQTIGAEDIETGLLNILYGGTSAQGNNSFNDSQRLFAQNLMSQAGISFTEGQGGGFKERIWDKESTGQVLNMNAVMDVTGSTVASQVFSRYYMNSANVVARNGISAIASVVPGLPNSTVGRFLILATGLQNFYLTGMAAVDDYNEIPNSPDGGFGYDPSYTASGQFHKGVDKAAVIGTPLYSHFSGLIVEVDSSNQGNSGNDVRMELGYKFENSFVSTGVQQNYFHMNSVTSGLSSGMYVQSGYQIGTSGNTQGTANVSTGAHAHTEMHLVSGYKFGNGKNVFTTNQQFTNSFLSYIRAPSLTRYSQEAMDWNNQLNHYYEDQTNQYWKTYYINANQLWR